MSLPLHDIRWADAIQPLAPTTPRRLFLSHGTPSEGALIFQPMARGRLYLRVEHDDWDFVRAIADAPPFDAAVVREDYLAPYPDSHPRRAFPPDELTTALRTAEIAWSLDPNTARFLDQHSGDGLAERAARSPLAQALSRPWDLEALQERDSVERIVDAAAGQQLLSRVMASPYVEVTDADDPRLTINAEFIRMTRERAGDRIVAGYLQGTGAQMKRGDLDEPAAELVAAGAEVIFVRLRRFKPEEASAEEVLAYAGLIEAITQRGARAVPDCVGRLGPVLVAAGADGFVTGAFRFRKVPDALLARSGGGRAHQLEYEVPGQFYGRARTALERELPPCPEETCEADDGRGDEVAVRIHNLHELRRLAREAGAVGTDFSDLLRAADARVASEWADALQTVARRRHAA
jgi:hypothetical protein